jgi:hypothetical protein
VVLAEAEAAVMGRDYEQIKQIHAEMEMRQLGITPASWVPETNRYGGWYGRNARPGEVAVAFVAERVNEHVVAPDWPPLYGGGSGLYLWKAVAVAGLKPHDMYYTNAVKPSGKVNNLREELHGEVLPDMILALGKTASDALWAAGVSHCAIPHPAYWKRFHTHDTHPKWSHHYPQRQGGLNYYAELIKEAARP